MWLGGVLPCTHKQKQTQKDKHAMYSSVSISCKIKDNYAINHRPRETRQQGVFMGHTQISKGKGNRKDFVSGLRADSDGNMSYQIDGEEGKSAEEDF